MELQTQHFFSSPSPHPCITAPVWVCLACGHISPYQGDPPDWMYSAEGLEDPQRKASPVIDTIPGDCDASNAAIGKQDVAPKTYPSSSSTATQHHSRHQPYGSVEHSYDISHHAVYSSSGDCVNTSMAPVAAGSVPTALYVPQAPSSSRREQQQHQRPSSVTGRTMGATVGDTSQRRSVDSAGDKQKRCDKMSLSENVSNSHADEEVFAADDFSGGGAISSNRRRRAPMTVTPPAMLQFSQPLGATCDKSDALAVNARASVVDNPPTLSASLPPSLWRNADVTGAQKVSGERSRFGHQEENVMDCPSVRLIEEHLIGSREMRFCLCCGEVRCAEIRTAAEVLRSSLLERGVGKALYTGRKGDEVMAAAQAAVDPQYKDWTAPWIGGCCSTDDISDGNWNAGAEFGPSISKSLCTDDESWRSLPSRAPLLDQRHQEQQQTPLQATSRTKTRSGTLALAAHLAQLLWRAGAFVLAAIRGFHPLSPVLPKMYLRSYRVFEHDPEEGTVACSHHSSSTPAIDSVQARARWISCPHCRCRKSCRPSCPLRELGETSQPRSGHVLGHLKSASDPTTNRRSSSTCTEGGAPEDSNGASSGSSGQPSWIFAAPDEEDAYTTAEDDDGLVIQRPRAEVESDEDAGTGAPENGRVCVQRSNDVDTSAQILTRVPLSSTVKRIIIARKDKWNTISLSEALWRLVLPTFSAPFLTTTPVPSTDIALAARTTAAGDASLLGGDKSFEYVADSSTPSLRPGAVESTRSRVVTGAPSFTCFRGDVEEAIRQLDGAQLEVAKLRLQQVLAALNAEQVKREGQMKDSYKCSV